MKIKALMNLDYYFTIHIDRKISMLRLEIKLPYDNRNSEFLRIT